MTDGWCAVGELGELEVPASLNALLASRLDALEPDEREVVRAMSVFGGAFPRESAVALSALDEAAVDRALNRSGAQERAGGWR